jgi:hypothetical protein
VVDFWAFALHGVPTEEEVSRENEMERQVEQEAEGGDKIEEKEEGGGGEKQKKVGQEDEKQQKQQDGENGNDKGGEEMKPQKEEGEVKGDEKKTKNEGHEKQDETENKTEISTPELVEKENSKSEEETESSEQKQTPTKGWSSYIPSVPSVRGRMKKSPTGNETTPEPAVSKDKDQEKEMSSSGSWGSYIPSFRGGKKQAAADDSQKEQRTWSSYIPSGKGFSSYVPKDAISSIAAMHQRDPTKSVAEQVYDFSKTPVGAAGLSSELIYLYDILFSNIHQWQRGQDTVVRSTRHTQLITKVQQQSPPIILEWNFLA